MKKVFLFLTIVLSNAVLFTSCVKDSAEYQQLLAQNDSLCDSLTNLRSQKDAEIDEMLKLLNEISDNFDAIASAESLITRESQNEMGVSTSAVERINKNFQLIQNALQKNREKIALLEQKAKKAGRENTELQATIERLTQQIDVQTVAVDSLQKEIRKKDNRIVELDVEVGRLNDENLEKSALIQQQADELSAAWYVFGTRKELKAQNIISGGVFNRRVLQKDFNKDYFVKIDKRQIKNIPVYSKKARLLTSHPQKSYEMATENGTKVIIIKDVDAFWSVSKYMVVQTN